MSKNAQGEIIDDRIISGVLPCPFCGAIGGERLPDGHINARGVMLRQRTTYNAIARGNVTQFFVTCHQCGTKGPNAANEAAAVKYWDRRYSAE